MKKSETNSQYLSLKKSTCDVVVFDIVGVEYVFVCQIPPTSSIESQKKKKIIEDSWNKHRGGEDLERGKSYQKTVWR